MIYDSLEVNTNYENNFIPGFLVREIFSDLFCNKIDQNKNIRIYNAVKGRLIFNIKIKNQSFINRLKRKYK